MNTDPSLVRRTTGPIPIRWLDEVDSTIDEAARRLDREHAPFAVVAARQTAGRGARGQSWASDEGGAWVTVASPGQGRPPDAALGLRLGLAAAGVASRFVAAPVRVKWPNDVMIGDRKLAGCLGVARPSGGRSWTLASVGMNVANETAAVASAISLAEAGATDADPAEVARDLAAAIIDTLEQPVDGWIDRVRAALWGVGRRVRFRDAGRIVEGELAGLTDDGTPLVRTDAGDAIACGTGAERVDG